MTSPRHGGLRQAIGFLTLGGGAAIPTPAALAWFGAVGAGIGAMVGAGWWATSRWLPIAVVAALAVVIDVALTGALHYDGLADAADGLLPPLSTDRRLEVMRDPRAGGFAVVVVGATLAVRVAALASIVPHGRAVAAMAALWAAARTAAAVVTVTVPYARPGGLATAFLGEPPAIPQWLLISVAGGVPAVALSVIGTVPALQGALSIAGCICMVALVVGLARRRLGGFTGDVLGASVILGETAGLVVLAVRP